MIQSLSKEVSLPFTVIGGYLGSGKTTLLNHCLENVDGLKFVVLVNDFGSVNIDASLIKEHSGDTLELANGCMCCSIAGGFVETLGEIRKQADSFDHLIIEASGVSDPARIAEFGQMYNFPLHGIVVMADAEQVRNQSEDRFVGDTVQRQLRQADLIVMNKVDLATVPELENVRSWLSELALGTPIVESVNSQIPIELLFEGAARVKHWPRATFHEPEQLEQHGPNDHSRIFRTWTIEHDGPVSRAQIEKFAETVGEQMYRVKGFIWLDEEPFGLRVFSQVGKRWSIKTLPAGGSTDQRTRLVLIGRHDARISNFTTQIAGWVDYEPLTRASKPIKQPTA